MPNQRCISFRSVHRVLRLLLLLALASSTAAQGPGIPTRSKFEGTEGKWTYRLDAGVLLSDLDERRYESSFYGGLYVQYGATLGISIDRTIHQSRRLRLGSSIRFASRPPTDFLVFYGVLTRTLEQPFIQSRAVFLNDNRNDGNKGQPADLRGYDGGRTRFPNTFEIQLRPQLSYDLLIGKSDRFTLSGGLYLSFLTNPFDQYDPRLLSAEVHYTTINILSATQSMIFIPAPFTRLGHGLSGSASYEHAIRSWMRGFIELRYDYSRSAVHKLDGNTIGVGAPTWRSAYVTLGITGALRPWLRHKHADGTQDRRRRNS